MKVRYLIFLLFLFLPPLSVLLAQTEGKIKKLEEKLKVASSEEKPVIHLQLSSLYKKSNPDKALDFANQAFAASKKDRNSNLQADASHMLGELYSGLNDTKTAIKYYETELELREKMPHTAQLAQLYFTVASVYKKEDKLRRAEGYFEKSLSAARKLALNPLILTNYEVLFSTNYDLGSYKEATGYFRLYIQMRDSVFQVRKSEEISELAANFEVQKKEKDKKIGELAVNNEVKSIQIGELNELTSRQQLLIAKKNMERNFLIAISGFILLIAFLLFNLYASKKKANALLAIQNAEIQEQKEEIETQRDKIISQLRELELLNCELCQQKEEITAQLEEIAEKSAIIEEKNRDITKSIEYALRIQQAILPPLGKIKASFPESFILYIPKDIVSGDFYWMAKAPDGRVFIAAADCTGHGVPGGFMSMIGVEKLNDIVNQLPMGELHPAQILHLLDEEIKHTLRHPGATGSLSDGLDIALCEFNFKSGEVMYSGANRPLWVVKNDGGNILEYAPVKKGIGDILEQASPYKNNVLDISPNDMIYLFSDGFHDQFGGESKKKLMKKNMKEILSFIHAQSAANQRKYLEKYFENWKHGEPQVDDVLILGIRY